MRRARLHEECLIQGVHRTHPFAGRNDPFTTDNHLDRGFGNDLFVDAPVGEDPEGLQLEEILLPANGTSASAIRMTRRPLRSGRPCLRDPSPVRGCEPRLPRRPREPRFFLASERTLARLRQLRNDHPRVVADLRPGPRAAYASERRASAEVCSPALCVNADVPTYG